MVFKKKLCQLDSWLPRTTLELVVTDWIQPSKYVICSLSDSVIPRDHKTDLVGGKRMSDFFSRCRLKISSNTQYSSPSSRRLSRRWYSLERTSPAYRSLTLSPCLPHPSIAALPSCSYPSTFFPLSFSLRLTNLQRGLATLFSIPGATDCMSE